MIWRYGVYSIAIGALIATCSRSIAQDVTASWYPLQPGDTWVYQKESLEGNMAHPDFERWTTEETVVSAVEDPELAGTLVTKRTKVLSDILSPDFIPGNDRAKRELPESHLLIRQGCVYVPRRTRNREELLRGDLAADYCFPMAKGMTWASEANESVWNVMGFNADPFGLRGGKTFHLTSHAGSGTSIDRWFEEGVGLLQEVTEHHGTYDEDRVQLLSATIDGKTQAFRLTPARTVPFGEEDCNGPRWRHFSRADGIAFSSLADCANYFKK